jgi:hypothetical protein
MDDHHPIPAQMLQTLGMKDLARMLYAAAIPLDQLTLGTYTLQLQVEDRLTGKSLIRQIDFVVE